MKRFAWVVLLLVACQAQASHGATCTHDAACPSPDVCVLGHCRAACRESRDCEVGARCLVEPATGVSVCSLPVIDDCRTATCAAGFVCEDGACLNACGSIARCPDGACVDDACLPVIGDAGVPRGDAGADAGAQCHGPGCDPIVDIEIGLSGRTYAVTAAGHVWTWGQAGSNGALGDGQPVHGACACAMTPVRVLAADGTPLDRVSQVVAGADFACALRRDATVWCWGYGGDGELGQGGGPSTVPVQVIDTAGAALDAVTALDAGSYHACALRGPARDVWCWGRNDHGQVGDGTLVDRSVAVHATELSQPVAEVRLSFQHTLVRLDDGTTRGVGWDQCAVVGTQSTVGSDVATAVQGPTGSIVSLATATWNTCTLDASGALSCWGLRDASLGTLTATFPTCSACATGSDFCATTGQPIALPTGVAFARIDGGGDGVFFGFTSGGALYLWGGIFGAPIGEMPTPARLTVGNGPHVVDADVYGHLCVLTGDGDVYCVGQNDNGQLGRGTMGAPDGRLAPVIWP